MRGWGSKPPSNNCSTGRSSWIPHTGKDGSGSRRRRRAIRLILAGRRRRIRLILAGHRARRQSPALLAATVKVYDHERGTSMTNETVQQIIDRAAADPDFRAALANDPLGAAT